MPIGTPTDRPGYLHEAVLYDSDEEFLGVVVPFLQEGVAAGEPCLVALGASTSRLVREAVGDSTGLTFLDDRYDRPASVIRSNWNRSPRTSPTAPPESGGGLVADAMRCSWMASSLGRSGRRWPKTDALVA